MTILSLGPLAPDRDAAYSLDPAAIFLARKPRLPGIEARKLMKLQHRPRQHKTAVGKLRRLVALRDVQLAVFIHAVLQKPCRWKRRRYRAAAQTPAPAPQPVRAARPRRKKESGKRASSILNFATMLMAGADDFNGQELCGLIEKPRWA